MCHSTAVRGSSYISPFRPRTSHGEISVGGGLERPRDPKWCLCRPKESAVVPEEIRIPVTAVSAIDLIGDIAFRVETARGRPFGPPDLCFRRARTGRPEGRRRPEKAPTTATGFRAPPDLLRSIAGIGGNLCGQRLEIVAICSTDGTGWTGPAMTGGFIPAAGSPPGETGPPVPPPRATQ
jgi:hypothetical protein